MNYLIRPALLVIVPVMMFTVVALSQNEDFTEDMDRLTATLFPESAPGGVIIVMKGDDIIYSKMGGLADLNTGTPIDMQTIFNTGSISKTFVANAILILHEEGKLNIKDPLSAYFDDFDDKEVSNAVTIKHLLSHTSGLPDLRDVRSNPDFYLTARDTANFEPLKRTREFNFEPGSQFEYSNPAYNGLALIVEKVSGQKWQDFVREQIFKPAGMHSSTITDGPEPTTGVAHAYVPAGDRFEEYDYGEFPTFAASGNGGIWCSIGDLVKYEKALQAGKIISLKMLAESRTPYRPDNWSLNDPPGIGYGWWIQKEHKHAGSKIEYHTGSQGGFRAFHIYMPDRDVIFCALFNQPVDTRKLFDDGLKVIGNHGL